MVIDDTSFRGMMRGSMGPLMKRLKKMHMHDWATSLDSGGRTHAHTAGGVCVSACSLAG